MLEADLPRIVVLATGGTIAGVSTPGATVRYSAGALSATALLAAVPALAELAHLRAEQLASVGSQDMSHRVWRTLLCRIQELSQDPEVDAVVITHGTDTLEETAFFLSLTAPCDKPIVLVGAMRPASALGADGPRNLYNACVLAGALFKQSVRCEPLVVMNDEIYGARDIRKTAASGVGAFSAPDAGPAGVIENGEAKLRSHPVQHREIFKLPANEANWPRVDVLYAHADMQADVADFMASQARGIVLAGVGEGNANQATMDSLRRAAARGVAVVRASRTGSGRVARNGEVDDDAAGFIAAGGLSPQKARILLMVALAQQNPGRNLQTIFELD